MSAELIFALFIVAMVIVIATTVYPRGRRRLIASHRVDRQTAPGARGPSEPDHDRGEHAPVDHGTR